MFREIAEIPAVVERQINELLPVYLEIGKMLVTRSGPIITCARGTSDQAAQYFKFLVESGTGRPVTSMPPSIASVYHSKLKLEDGVCLSISQSGGSPDLLALQNAAQEGGAIAVSVLNTIPSPMSVNSDYSLPLVAGKENAVAATKSFVASLVAVAAIYAGMKNDTSLIEALKILPDSLDKSLGMNWDAATDAFKNSQSLFVLGRGAGYAIAGEASLKLKETCQIHAESYSAAEVQHGPMVLARKKLAVLAFFPSGRGHESVLKSVEIFSRNGASVFTVGSDLGTASNLSSAPSPHFLLNEICQITSFYKFVEKLSCHMGLNPDKPPLLNKITETI
ncbi:MAG: SIS domain-containing protein [Rhizobiales bacterium]|nr:SIS domain-containing protein [Hyphomicrobiales bacterium]